MLFGNDFIKSSVAFTHDEVQTAEHGRNIAHHATGKKLWQNTQVYKRRRPYFQTARHTAALAIDIESQFAFRVFGREIDFSRRRVEPFGDENKMMDQLLHLGQHMTFV